MMQVADCLAWLRRQLRTRRTRLAQFLAPRYRWHALSARLLWRRRAVRDLSALTQELEQLSRDTRALQSVTRWDLRLRKELIGKIARTITETRKITVVSRGGPHVQRLSSASRMLRSHRASLAELQELIRTNGQAIQSRQSLAADLRDRSNPIPGTAFQQSVSKYFSRFNQRIRQPEQSTARTELNAALDAVDCVISSWQALVAAAEESRSGVETLSSDLESFDKLDVMQDPAGQQAFETIESAIGTIRDAIRLGNYTQAYSVLQQNRTRCQDLHRVIARRYDYVREEIRLWAQRPSVRDRFPIHRFLSAPNLTPELVNDWRTLCGDIEVFVQQRAAAVRQENASAIQPATHPLTVSWEQTRRAQHLVQFAQAVAQCRIQQLPGESSPR
jgi:hypothetical protein